MTRNTALRLLALLLSTLLFGSLATDAELGIGGLFVGWGLSTVLLGKLLVVYPVTAVSAIRAAATCRLTPPPPAPLAPPKTTVWYSSIRRISRTGLIQTPADSDWSDSPPAARAAVECRITQQRERD